MRAEKQLLLDSIKEKIEVSNAIIVTNYKNFDPGAAWDFRVRLKEAGGSFEIMKKRIFLKAAKASGMSLDLKSLEGSIGVIFAEGDGIAPAKFIYKFDRENGAEFNVLNGFFEGKEFSKDEVKELSKLPTKKEMQSQFIGLLEAPMRQTLAVFESMLSSILHCLQNKIEKS